MNNETKKPWHFVHRPNSGLVTDFLVVEGDPDSNVVIGCYPSLSDARYKAKLHNIHVSRHPVLREVDRLYHGEVSFEICAFWAGGISWGLGLHPVEISGTEETIEEALAAMTQAAAERWPESTYARLFKGGAGVKADQRDVEDLARELEAAGHRFALSFDSQEPDFYACPWTVEIEGQEGAFQGYTAEEALKEALASLAPALDATVG